jgi:hypothetical protein
MMFRFFKISFLLVFLGLAACAVSAQDASLRLPPDPGAREKEELPKTIKEMLIRKRIEQEKKDHDELLKRGEEAMEISDQLEQAFAQNNKLTESDRERLDYLAGLVKKIRKDIGGSDDGEDDPDAKEEAKSEDKPSTLQDAFKALQTTTVKLVDELKKTTRFTISAIAIQSSNSLLRIVRFIRTGR